jgi:threonylcarbamoyladenosine tRNA methylthiotransferase MtaB
VSGNDLGGLIEAVAATGVKRLRLSSIEPRDLTPGFLDAVAHTPTFCPHLHVPLQSGCDQILSAMNRGYTSDEYRQFVADARDAVPGLALTTDVIVGFPGESDGQAGETRDFCESIGFRRMHVFRYSRRANTPAAARVDQVTPAAKSARAAQLRGLSSRLWIRDVEGCLGQLRELLVERLGEDGTRGCVIEGTTRDYLRVRVRIDQEPGSAAPDVGSLAAVRLTRIEGERVGAVLMS